MTPLEQKWRDHLVARHHDLADDRNHYAYARRTQDEDDRAVEALSWRLAEMAAAQRPPNRRVRAEISRLRGKQATIDLAYHTLVDQSLEREMRPTLHIAGIIEQMATARDNYERQIALLKRTLAALEAEHVA